MPLSFFANSGNSYGSAIPFQRIVEPAQLGLFLNLEQAELLRIQRYNEHWRFYFGKQWIYDREDGEPLVTINYSRLIVDKSVSWLVKNGFEIKVPEALKNVVTPFLKEVWEYNRHKQFLYDMATMGAVTGDVFVMVTYEEPSELAKRRNPNSQGSIKIDLLGSEQVYPSWDPLNTNVLTSVRIETLYYDDRNQLNRVDRDDKANHQGRQLYVKKFSQIITPNHIIEQYEGGQPIIRENILGEIPIVHIRNLPLPREFYGLSDLDGIVDLQRETNEKATDVSDTIAYHASPVTVITGAKASQLERGARQIWSGLPADARVENLRLEGDLTASREYLTFIKDSMLQVSETPEALLTTPEISNTSGVALAMQFQPIVDKTKRKLPFYELGMEQINYFALRIGSALGMLRLPWDLCSQCGGRIVEVLDSDGHVPRMRKRCFHIDPDTLDFRSPEQMEVVHVRQHSFGNEMRESRMKQVEEEHGKVNPSEWDPEQKEDQQQKEDRQRKEQEGVTKRKGYIGPAETAPKHMGPMVNPKREPPKLSGQITLPHEPEEVLLSRILTHPTTGETQQIIRQRVKLVPTGCKRPQYLDPYTTEVNFLDALPRDIHQDILLYNQMSELGLVSKAWIRRKLKVIHEDEYDDIERELEEEKAEEMMAAETEAKLKGEGEGKPGLNADGDEAPPTPLQAGNKEQQRALQRPGGHNDGQGRPSKPKKKP